jgi:chemotaxis protein MotB
MVKRSKEVFMGRMCLAGVVLVLVAGCAFSDVNRMNSRLKDENARLLSENRELQAKAEGARKDVTDKQMEIERLKEELATARRGQGQPKPAVAKTTGAFDGVKDVEVQEGADQTRVILKEEIFFSSGSCEITERGKKTLDQVAGILKDKYRGNRIRIEGHTDNQPIVRTRDKYASNWELSGDRAFAVVRFLESKGVSPGSGNLYGAGYGQYSPVASNDTPAGRQKNRRVEIVIAQ